MEERNRPPPNPRLPAPLSKAVSQPSFVGVGPNTRASAQTPPGVNGNERSNTPPRPPRESVNSNSNPNFVATSEFQRPRTPLSRENERSSPALLGTRFSQKQPTQTDTQSPPSLKLNIPSPTTPINLNNIPPPSTESPLPPTPRPTNLNPNPNPNPNQQRRTGIPPRNSSQPNVMNPPTAPRGSQMNGNLQKSSTDPILNSNLNGEAKQNTNINNHNIPKLNLSNNNNQNNQNNNNQNTFQKSPNPLSKSLPSQRTQIPNVQNAPNTQNGQIPQNEQVKTPRPQPKPQNGGQSTLIRPQRSNNELTRGPNNMNNNVNNNVNRNTVDPRTYVERPNVTNREINQNNNSNNGNNNLNNNTNNNLTNLTNNLNNTNNNSNSETLRPRGNTTNTNNTGSLRGNLDILRQNNINRNLNNDTIRNNMTSTDMIRSHQVQKSASSPDIIKPQGQRRESPILVRNKPSESNAGTIGRPSSPNQSSNLSRPPPQVPKRDLTDLLPFKIILPNEKQAVVRCAKESTVSEFTSFALAKLKQEYIYNPNEKYELRLDGNEKLDNSVPIVQNPTIKKCLERNIIPTVFLLTVGSHSRRQSVIVAKPIDKAEVARLVSNFEVQFLLPGGSNLNLSVSFDTPLSQVKEKICFEAQNQKKLLLLNPSLYEFRTYSDKSVLHNEQISIGNVPYISQCRKHCTTPKLVLGQKEIEPYSDQEKKRTADINKLVGRLQVVSDANDEVEIQNFRGTLARLRYLERKRKKVGGKARDRVTLKIMNDPLPSSPNTIMASIGFPLLAVKKTIIIYREETATMFIERVFDKHYAKKLPNKKPSDFIFKAAGLREFIYGDHYMFSFEHIRNVLAKNERPELIFSERSALEVGDDDEDEVLEEQWQQGGEEMLEACTIKYDHKEICSDDISWDQKTHISIWELCERIRIRVMGVESITQYYQSFSKVQDGSYYLYIAAGLYYGGELLVPLQFSDKVPVDYSPRWYQWLTYPIEVRNIPRATRLCMTLFATTKSGAITNIKKDIPIGWVNSLLFSHNHELKTGIHSLNLWFDEKANPIGSCVQNSSKNSSPLFIEFDSYQLPVVFPTKDPELSFSDAELIDTSPIGSDPMEAIYSLEKVDIIIQKDPLYILHDNEKKLLWRHRKYCMANYHCLPKFLVSVPHNSRNNVFEMHKLLSKWEPLLPLDALELLDYRFPDAKVREYAVKCLAKFEDADLQTYLLQLVQVLKYEPHHDSALARFLIRRGLRSQRVGHTFFWYLKGEMHVPEIRERYALLLEGYLYGSGSYLFELAKQCEILNSLQVVANHIKTVNSNERKDILISMLKKIEFPEKFQLPLDPSWEARSLIYEKCKYMDSKKLPLWLVFNNADADGQPITVIFKSGDDLRQDMLTLQIIRIMDKLWKSEGLDLQLSPYGCISTGDEVGFIEVVLNSATTAQISRESGGAAGALKKSPLAHWLQAKNPGDLYEAAVQRFIVSCAGYCVATYVLGIGDRHNDNIMVQKNGRLFHIDFGHFLGNFKKKFGVSRERAKFVFTPDFAYVMGGVDSPNFHRFVTLCCEAYNILRKHASKFINLLAMMLSTGIPELTKPKDIDYLRNNLCLDMEKDDAAASFVKQISASLGCKTTIVNNFIHILAH